MALSKDAFFPHFLPSDKYLNSITMYFERIYFHGPKFSKTVHKKNKFVGS